jgi:5-methylthioadenosine/S-adenosylhomocysteine deaminase
MSTLIRGGRVLRADLVTYDPADVLIEHGFIRAIEPVGRITRGDVETIEAAERLLVPGLVNGHTHAHGGLGKGAVGDRVPLEVFLSASGVINGSRTVEDKRLSATLTAVELVRKGCTAVYDLFVEYPVPSREGLDAVAEAYGTVGMRAVIAPMMADRTLYEALPGLIESLPPHLQEQARRINAAPYEASVAAARDILANWRHDRDKLRPALGPTIPLHCSDAFLVECARLAEEYDVLLQTHLAESKTQAVLGYKKYGRSLVAHLQALNVLGPRLSAAHGIWLDTDDISRLAAAGAGVVHNPMSNLRLGSGVAPSRALRLQREWQDGRVAAGDRRTRAGEKIVGHFQAGRGRLGEMHVAVDAARHHDQAGCVDLPRRTRDALGNGGDASFAHGDVGAIGVARGGDGDATNGDIIVRHVDLRSGP